MPGLDHSALTGVQLHGAFHYEQEGDPGAVGAFKWWFRPSTGVLKRRNTGDTDWIVVFDPTTVPSSVTWKQPVRVATMAAGTLATDFENGDTIDGVSLVTGDRILLKNQAAGAENGIYVVAASGAPVRASDADSAAELVGAIVIVKEGTANADTGWLATNDSITLGTTALVFTKAFPAAAGITDHGALTGLSDDDHPQYQLLAAKGAANGYAPLNASSRVPIVNLASGTPDGTKFIRDDGALAVPAGGGGAGTIIIEELDGTPTGAFDTLKFPNGTLTDNADGSATYAPAGGGGGVGDHGCHVYASADQAASNAVWTGPNLANERYDTDGYHFTSNAALTGTVAKTNGSATLTGTGTSFTTELSVGQIISVPGGAVEKKVVTAIASNTSLTVASNFANTSSGQTATRVNYAISIPTGRAGRYILRGKLYWASNNSNFRYGRLYLNDTTQIEWSVLLAMTAEITNVIVEIEWDLAVNDLVELQGFHTSAGNPSLLGSPNPCSLQIRQVA